MPTSVEKQAMGVASYNATINADEPTKLGRPSVAIGNERFRVDIEDYLNWIREKSLDIIRYNVNNVLSGNKDIVPNRNKNIGLSSLSFLPSSLRNIDEFVTNRSDKKFKDMYDLSSITKSKKAFAKYLGFEKRISSRVRRVVELLSKGV